jgi:hypothetical protein
MTSILGGVSAWSDAPTSLPLAKQSPVPTEWEDGNVLKSSGGFEEKLNILPLLIGIEPPCGFLARNLVIIPNILSQLLFTHVLSVMLLTISLP